MKGESTAAGPRPDGAGDTSRCWRFGEASLDERSLVLTVRGSPVGIDRKPLEVLLYLLRNPGKLVTKDELLAAVWPGRVLSDAALTSCVARLRSALGDEGQAVVKTVHGYGYRLAVPVEESLPEASAGPAPAAGRPRLTTPVAGAVVAAAFAMAAWMLWDRTQAPPPSVAVLPFSNLSPEPDAQAHIVDGLHDTIISHLARIRDLKVISRTSVMRYRGGGADIREIGDALGVAHVLEGSVQRVEGRVRVNAQLIEVSTDRHLWADVYDRDLADLLGIQSDVAQRVAAAVGVRLSSEELAAIQHRSTQSSAAYDLYLRARSHERTDTTSREHLFKAQAMLERAVAEDPEFALAHAALARVHALMYWFSYDPAVERREQARAAAERALALEPDLPEAHMSLGLYRTAGFRDFDGAIEAYERALRGQPNLSEIHRYIGSAQRRQGRWKEALASLRRAVELDPGNVGLLEDLAGLYHRGLRRYDEAAPLYDRVVSLAPDEIYPKITRALFLFDWKGTLDPLREVLDAVPAGVDPDNMVSYFRYLLAMWEGRYEEAAQRLAAYPPEWLPASGGSGRVPKELSLGLAHELSGRRDLAAQFYLRARGLLESEIGARPNSPGEHVALGLALAGLGERAAAERAAQRALDLMPASVDPVAHADLALQTTLIHLKLGDAERALARLERLVGMPYGPSAHALQKWPYWRPLHGDSRFEALIASNLPRN